MKIVVDLMGGDNAPEEIVAGCVDALNSASGFDLVLCGKLGIVQPMLTQYKFDPKRVEVIDADEIITNDDSPTQAIKTKKNSSLILGLDRLKDDRECEAFVSAGSTGAMLAASVLKLGRIPGISRPALATLFPSVKNESFVLLDCGANADCKPEMLLQFAIMGSAYAYSVLGRAAPRVALLNNGTEESKGNQLTKDAYALLKGCGSINFVGNVEARDILSGDFDVVVADGFSGNIALKSCEGTAISLLKQIKAEVSKSFKAKIGALFMKKALGNIKKTMDYNNNGGALYCGLNKIVLKTHGSAKAAMVKTTILQALEMANRKLIGNIEESIAALAAE